MKQVTRQQYSQALQEWVGDYTNRVPKTIGDAVRAHQISVIRGIDPDTLNVALSRLITDALILSSKQVSDELVGFIGGKIKSTYPYFRLGELAMVIQKGVTGYYGMVPSGANPVLYWCQRYDQGEREDYFLSQAQVHKEPFEKAEELEKREQNQKQLSMIKDQMMRIDSIEKAKERLKLNEK